MDNGGGAFRGVYLQGNEAVSPIFEAWMKPFANLGMNTLTIRPTSGTDHLAFDGVGLPGFQFVQDPPEHGSRTHHTNLDVYERAIPDDLTQNAIIIATWAYHAAMRDQPLPRKPLPKPQPETTGPAPGDAPADRVRFGPALVRSTGLHPAPSARPGVRHALSGQSRRRWPRERRWPRGRVAVPRHA